MLRIRIIAVAAAPAIASFLWANGATAQTASADQSGQPLSLSRLVTQTTTAPAQPSNSMATGRRHMRRVARRRHRSHHLDQADDPTPSRAAGDDGLDNAAPAASALASPSAPAADGDRAQQDDASLPSAVVVGGQTVPIATADQINALDIAADNSPPEPMPHGDGADAAATDTSAAPPAAFDASAPAMQDQRADAVQNAGAQGTTTRAMSARQVPAEVLDAQDLSDQNAGAENSASIGSTTWIAQGLAALAGAIAAGVLAWFLIGDGPVRTYR